MATEVSLMSEGHLPLAEIRDVLESAGCGPVTFRVTELDDATRETMPLHATFSFKDPTRRRQGREMRIHHGVGVDREDDPIDYIPGEDYTHFTMGAHDGGPQVMRALAEAFGGGLSDDRDDSVEVFPRRGGPTP